MMPTQKQTIDIIKRVLSHHETLIGWRLVKIHGGPYQEAGLPDVQIYLRLGHTNNIYLKHYWLEVKRSWKDRPTDLQKHNINELGLFGWRTGYVVGDEFKYNWEDDAPIKVSTIF